MNKVLTLLLASALAVTACSDRNGKEADGAKDDYTSIVKRKNVERGTKETSPVKSDPVSVDNKIVGVYYSCAGMNILHMVSEDSDGNQDTSTLVLPVEAGDTSAYNAAAPDAEETAKARISVQHLENGNDLLTIKKGDQTFSAIGKFAEGFTLPENSVLFEEYQDNLGVHPKLFAKCESPARGHEVFTTRVQ